MAKFVSKRIVRSGICKFNEEPEAIFPLLCPVREKDWVVGWNYEMIYSESGYNENGCTFKSEFSGEDAIWTVITYDREKYDLEAVIFVKDMLVVKFLIRLGENEDGTTNALISQTFTSISEKGSHSICENTEELYSKYLAGLEKSMNYYLENGKMISALKFHH